MFVCIKNTSHLSYFCSSNARRYRFVNRWRVLLGSIYNKPVNANVAEVKTIVYHSSYLPFVDANIDDNSRDIAVLALTQPLTFNGRTHLHIIKICLVSVTYLLNLIQRNYFRIKKIATVGCF